MMAPNRPTSRLRPLSNKTIRTTALLGLVAIAVTVLFSTNSSAGSLSQKLFASAAAALMGSKAPETAHAHHSLEFAEAAAPESSTMSVARRGHTATRLSDGRVLIAGGENSSGTLNDSELYDPSSATFAAGANMGAARADHSATLLADGRVLIAGGRNGAGALATTEMFDPATGAFTSGPSMSVARAGHSATLFADGRVFIAGGEAGGSAEVLNVATGDSTAAGSMGVARSMHSAALLQDGRVLVVGGRDAGGNELNSGEIFDTPASAFWTIDGALKVNRVRANLRVLFDGKVQIIGGSSDGSMEIYDPVFEGFGAYAHVLPESDPCTGFVNHVLASQTRAALFRAGHNDPLFDRSGHTITELNGQALVLGGVNGSGAVLSSSAVVASSGASITTDKMDYAPGEIATITGRGFGAGEVVRLKIHEDPHTPQERGLDVTADADGNFTGEYLVMDYDLDMKFIVGARGLTSGRTAQTTFTDARLNTLTVGPQSPNPVTPGSSASYTVTVGFNGNATNCTVNLTALGLPAGVGFSFTPSSVTGSGVVNINSALSVSTLVSTPGGSHPFTVRATTTAGCQNHPATIDASATLVVAGDADTTTTVNNATATYGDLSVNLSATVSSTSTVNVGTVTFTVKQGATTIGVATTSGTVSGGNASVSYALPAGTDAGPYTIEATYNAGAGFNTSSGTGSLTINKRDIEVTADPKSKVYGDADPALTYQITSGSLVFGDTIVGALARAAGENVGTYAITQGTLAINDGNGGNNYNLTFVGADFTITARPITITADQKSKVYGDPDPALTYQITSGSLAFSDAIVGALVRAAGENVGTYAITQGTLAINDGNGGNNYNLTFVSANLSITKRPIQVTATAGQFKIYGDPDPVFAYTLTSGTLAFSDTFTGALSRVAGENVGLYAITIGTLKVNDGNNGDNYNLTLVSNNFEIKKRLITVKADAKTKTFGDPDPVFTYQITSGSLAFTDTFTGALTRDPGELVGVYAIKIGTLAINDGNGGNNYTLTFVGDNLTILTACSVFNGFLSPIGGAVEKGNGGSFADPVRAFKLNSTIPVKFNAICFGTPLVTGVHTLQAIKYSNSTDSEPAIDATPTDAATMGNQFRLTGTEWHFNLNTKALGGNAQGTWLLKATLFDGSSYTVWVSIKK